MSLFAKENVLLRLYPQFIKNCKSSLEWIESGASDEFHASRNLPVFTPEEKADKIAYYKGKIAQYEKELSDVSQ